LKINKIPARPDWQKKCEALGFYYHSIDGKYWCDEYCYELSVREVEILKKAGQELHAMYMEMAREIIESGDYLNFNFSDKLKQDIETSWADSRDTVNSLYGRFDLSYENENKAPKLLEYNADTPTTFLESSIIQAQWLSDVFPQYQQFNTLAPDLIERWRAWGRDKPIAQKVYFASLKFPDDEANTIFMMDLCMQAGFQGEFIHIDEIRYSEEQKIFTDSKGETINYCYKLYPWEWIAQEEDFENIRNHNITFIEPAWKLVLSNKAMLVHLWKKYKNHPNLLAAHFTSEEFKTEERNINTIVKKQIFSREGWNIQIIESGKVVEESLGMYSGPSIYQEYAPVAHLNERWTPTGLWMVGDKVSGLGFRDDYKKITTDTSWFAPHYVRE